MPRAIATAAIGSASGLSQYAVSTRSYARRVPANVPSLAPARATSSRSPRPASSRGNGSTWARTMTARSTSCLRRGSTPGSASDLPHPRHYTIKTSPEFMDLKARLTEEIRAESLAAAAH